MRKEVNIISELLLNRSSQQIFIVNLSESSIINIICSQILLLEWFLEM